ncbi:MULTISPECIES: NADH-quinone oxidoreductase subunit J [Rhodoferax]|uniref:NADH-quinone oxidoreductase subunit J n=1 Tax=Rhodoferax fermentans TaxID=28066 RepID=A0A1T1AQ35_RHOFE|nr:MULTISPECIES: NADH-quinone oxidoreductase subunit J [Rhodoferax]MBK1682726.1 NADH:ubiquinone oxidoreductase subunit J [Rhodoferax fermentans]MBT3065764.1 NADH-quinone oxidoreductase subunit J [Rhodoferax sp. U11-2br]OOV06103.1 NADH:ubiquinone oxidoreductase subunit J [Rhodoferax fermentans]
MSVTTGLFYLFSAILLAAAFRVITTRNPVHAVLYLVLTFFQASMIWMLLKAEFLSLTLVLVYVGAVMVLFLFVVMMLDVNTEEMRKGFWKHFPLAAVLGLLIIAEMSAVLLGGFQVADAPSTAAAVSNAGAELSNSKLLGKLLYTQYIYPLEVATAILLVGMIAAIALTLRQRKDSKAIDPAAQVRVRAKDRMIVVKMAATQPALPVDAVEAPSVENKA